MCNWACTALCKKTYSFPSGTEPRRFGFCTMLAWLRSVMLILDGRRRHGSPSTCIGIVLYVVSSTDWHCSMRSPWPPTCSAACRESVTSDNELMMLLRVEGKWNPLEAWRSSTSQVRQTLILEYSTYHNHRKEIKLSSLLMRSIFIRF